MNYQLEFRHINYFLAVAEHLHFRKAAEMLHISQPGLSRQIKEMEEHLDLKLFDRHNRKVTLTASGEYLKKDLTSAIKHIDGIFSHAKLLQKGYEGSLNLAYIGSAMQDVIPQFLLKIKKETPNIRFDLQEMDNSKQLNAILNQSIDIGFVRMDRVPDEIEIHPIFEDTFSLVLPKNHPINETNFKNLNQLKDETFILFDPSYSKSYFEKVMTIFEDSKFSPITSHNTVHAYTIYRLIENNLGVSIVPTSLQHGYNMDVKFIELKKIKQRTTLRAIWNKKNKNPVLTHVINMIK